MPLLRSLLSDSGCFCLFLTVLADGYLLYSVRGIQAFRQCADRFSNGDENEVSIRVESSYSRPVALEIIDEIPFIFQKRDIGFASVFGQTKGKRLVTGFVLRVGAFILSDISRFSLPGG